ncbi:DGQHR domain-containing protein DpdB [Actinosynnema pretiosum]|uniref:DGQHR domain-containing protein n=1 Tax=Actinosynnema pretiosum TaxID=42197 RepID=A0A290Z3U2_9PSEU|nr:DGQHR domain-containing protein DpdB [Actinosynnema pretiosum]ATE53623.1 hypothetical protein CNX65_10240 [Actinosynnema pretiosum]
MSTTCLRLPAIQIRQRDRCIYTAAVDGKRLSEFAAISRARRDDKGLSGYQRPEVLAHVRGIRRYLESSGALLPNAIVVAFDDTVEFVPYLVPGDTPAYAVPGELVIPLDSTAPEWERPAWIVDGQQRTAAIRDARVPEFPVAIVGFIATEEEQRSQFILVNSTKTLPPGLIHELLPDAPGRMPTRLERRRPAATIMARLNAEHGPFHRAISTPTSPNGRIKDTSVLKMVENSLFEGGLYQYRDRVTGDVDTERAVNHLNLYWAAVRETWPTEWALPPRLSRLTHGAGVIALGCVMDALTETTPAERLAPAGLRDQLAALRPHTAWTNGSWRLAGDDVRHWNAIQNTGQDLRSLSEHLLRHLLTNPTNAA